MGNLICCCWRMFCCDCACEGKDDWTISNETRPGERGAGYLYKRAKNSAMWSKRYFTITDHKMLYYTDRDRATMKGEIVLAGAQAVISTTRPDTKNKFYFNITHPVCGVREVYTKTRNRRKQWIEKINDVSAVLQQRVVYGKLLKQGGLSKNVWQERWCICTGVSIDYFDGASDNQSKGNLVITGASINATKVKDKFCFEVVAQAAKKGGKKYVFACEKEHDRDKWVEMLKRFAGENPASFAIVSNNSENVSPLQKGAGTGAAAGAAVTRDEDDEEDGEGRDRMESVATDDDVRTSRISMTASADQAGYLLKKSPALMKGWQKRYFKTLANGDIQYFKSEEQANTNDKEEKGVIRLADIRQDKCVELNEKTFEFTIYTTNKAIHLKASSLDEATDWCRNIMAWVQSTK